MESGHFFSTCTIVQAEPSPLDDVESSVSTGGRGEELSPHGMEVFQLLVQGKQNKEIAAELSIFERTVKFHISSILAKLGAGNRTEAVTIAFQEGLVEL